MIAARTDTEVGRGGAGERGYRFVANHGAPTAARARVESALEDVGGGAKLTAGLLTRALVAICIRGEGGEVRLRLAFEPERVRVEVSGEGAGFRLPLSPRAIDYLSLGDQEARPVGWRSYLLDQLADGWGVDDEAGAAWFEVDHATTGARRLTNGSTRTTRSRAVA